VSVKQCFVGQETQTNLNCTLFSSSDREGLFKGDTIFFNMGDRAGNETPNPGLKWSGGFPTLLLPKYKKLRQDNNFRRCQKILANGKPAEQKILNKKCKSLGTMGPFIQRKIRSSYIGRVFRTLASSSCAFRTFS